MYLEKESVVCDKLCPSRGRSSVLKWKPVFELECAHVILELPYTLGAKQSSYSSPIRSRQSLPDRRRKVFSNVAIGQSSSLSWSNWVMIAVRERLMLILESTARKIERVETITSLWRKIVGNLQSGRTKIGSKSDEILTCASFESFLMEWWLLQ